ncbi:MAG: nicotinate-nucleotide adenylyltransferase [Alphaproteobacteria bacterium]|nr:nicotinate-nucleotide adenylyltransferase [Alphaproteobacteria bacterium]
MDKAGLPVARAGMTIGLLGGSFDPPHRGHVHVTREALRRFGLDRVWWLVSPGNPLKSKGPAPLERRLAASRDLMRHPRVTVTDIEARMGTRYTAATLGQLVRRYPGVRFVWLMGADNLAGFHRWDRWQWILETVPIGVIARPGQGIAARLSPAAAKYERYRLRGREAALLSRTEAPVWCMVNVPLDDTSSTQIRAQGGWTREP